MDRSRPALSLVLSAFEGQDELIENAFRANGSFRSLCEDYAECVNALQHWKRLDGGEARQRQQEFAQLLVDLDREIQTWLEALEAGTTPTRTADPRE